jgi:hypothetical protein
LDTETLDSFLRTAKAIRLGLAVLRELGCLLGHLHAASGLAILLLCVHNEGLVQYTCMFGTSGLSQNFPRTST